MEIIDIIDKATAGHEVSLDETERLLMAKGRDRESIFSAAREVRDKNFGKKVFIYGFVYFSTYCRNNCNFCYYRRTNDLPRYRKSADEILALSASLKDAGINLVDLTMGEDPHMCADGHRELIDLVRRVKDEIGIAVMVSPGAMPKGSFKGLKDAGADWFACYQETYNKDLFSKLRIEQDFDHRLDQRIWARGSGMLTEDGMMVGLGETARDRAEAILKMGSLGCEQIRAMTFVPQSGTPMFGLMPTDAGNELLSIAVMRILFPDRLIPASLDVEGIAGLRTRIDAGANVITSIVPPHKDLAGVAQHELDIDNGHRSVDHVIEMLDGMGRRAATSSEYDALIARLKSNIRIGE
ncbi:MAG: methylornithine synthase PylB [Candidatus Methanoplasma sp.]|nr:methylornithine synthase PylB [Candidatus Methanoplasma sp.]